MPLKRYFLERDTIDCALLSGRSEQSKIVSAISEASGVSYLGCACEFSRQSLALQQGRASYVLKKSSRKHFWMNRHHSSIFRHIMGWEALPCVLQFPLSYDPKTMEVLVLKIRLLYAS